MKRLLLPLALLAFVRILLLSNCGSSGPVAPRTQPIDCNTPAGILAMMAPPAIESQRYVHIEEFEVRTKLFKTDCPTCGTAEMRCWERVRMHIFWDTDPQKLESLPELASSGNFDQLWNRVTRSSRVWSSIAGNPMNERSLSLFTQFQPGNLYALRFAKEIEQDDAINPFVWSEIFLFSNLGSNPTISSTNPGCTQAELEPAPRNDEEILVFSDLDSSFADSAGNTFIKTARQWCNGFFDSSGQLLFGTVSNDPSPIVGEIRQLTITLPPITWGVRETNNVNVNTPFTVSLFRFGESNAIDTFNVSSINAGDTVTRQFTNRGTRTVFLFPSQGLDKCWVKTFVPNQGALDVRERDFEVKVDTGSAVAECSETNNRRTYSNTGSTTFITNQQ